MSLHVFDLDHTLLRVNSSYQFGHYLYRQKFFSWLKWILSLSDYACHKSLGLSLQTLHARVFTRLFKGCPLADIHLHVEKFLTEHLASMLYEPVMQRLKEAQARGDHILILSSSPDFLVGAIAHRLHVTHWKATVYRTDAQGRLTAIDHVLGGQDKASYVKDLREQLKLSSSSLTVYSDSYLDLPVLKIAGHAIGVVPDHRLKRLCIKNGWEIL